MAPTQEPPPASRDAADTGYVRQLFYRWFVEYNPLYLLSAALVLGGSFLLSQGLAGEESLLGTVGIALVAEVYAACLVGGAALLTRIGMKRPAVMLALIFVLYQWDITLHTETCAYLGAPGAWATAGWLAIFAGKLYALAWALRLRFSRQFLAAAVVAALGLALGPRLLPVLGARMGGACVAVWLFALLSLYREGGITSRAPLDAWGATVLRRATLAAWLLSGALVGMHLLFWWRDHELSLTFVLSMVVLEQVRGVRSERRVWGLVLGTLAVVALWAPSTFSGAAFVAAAALTLRALAPRLAAVPSRTPPREEAPAQPYRAGGAAPVAPEPQPSLTRASVDPAERARLLVGALFAAHLSVWTLRWTSGPWPSHVLALDLALTAFVLLAMWKGRIRSPLAPLATWHLHFVLAAHLVPAPRTHLEWGASAVGLGFLLLAGSLAASYRLRVRPVVVPGGVPARPAPQ
jgi:hypothetical protein